MIQDTKAKHSLLLASPGFDQPKFIHGKEIGALQALTSTPPANKSKEDLQSLVHEITSVVEEAKAMTPSPQILSRTGGNLNLKRS